MWYAVLVLVIALLVAAVIFFATRAGDKKLREKISIKSRENDDLNIEIKDIKSEREKKEKEVKKLEEKEIVWNERVKNISVPGDSVDDLLEYLEKQ